MSIPKSKMISASKAIMALAAKGKYQMDESCRAIQNQTVTVNVQQHPATTVTTQHTPASVITNTNPHTPGHYSGTPAATITPEPSSFQTAGQTVEEPINVVERDIVLEPEEPVSDIATKDFYEELDNLHAIVNNYETVAKALILIIELLQSNPLKLNKIIVPTEPAFKELILVLTGADDVEIRYSEDIACGISSKKYRVIEDIIVVHNQEPKSLKYSHPDIIRLFDRFNISLKMIAK
jgi:hypothetical protein